ncbi:MAG: hypothetical protein RJA31_161 [Actinomycetota bacterium]
MRFFYAIVIFAASLAFFAGSLVIRYFFSAPDTLTQSIQLTGDAPIAVIDAAELRLIAGSETLTASVAPTADGDETNPVTIGWGRTPDVMAWVGNASYHFITVDKETGELTDSLVSGLEPEVPDPRGSDLWTEEWNGDESVSAELALRKGHSIIVATDGVSPAPSTVTVIWNLAVDRTIPTILLYLAAASGMVGLGAFVWALWRERRQRRHRQGRMPKAPKPPRWRPKRPGFLGARGATGRRGRRLAGMVVATGLVPALLVGCASGDSVQPTPTPVATAELPYVAMTGPQFERILEKIVETLEVADEKRAENIAATRLQGSALRFRQATYRVQGANSTLGTLFQIPNGTVSLMLPQQTDGWPRSVFAIIDDTASEEAPSVAIILTQDGPRANYHVDYTFALEPGVVMPEVPSAEYGTAVLPADTELLSSTPAQVAEQYADLLINGAESPYASIFEADTLQEQIGAEAKAQRVADMKGSMKFSWVDSMTEDVPIVFATSDAGALVALTINEAETVRPARGGSAISTEGAVKILSGRPSSLRGITANYQYQLLLHVPAIGTSDQIRLLGYSYALVSAQEYR